MLTVFWTDEEGDHEIPLTNPMNRIGRSPEANLQIANASISRRHAVLFGTDGVWTLRDLNSQNGTSVDDRLVREHTVSDGDCVLLGEVALRFVASVKDSIRLNDALHPDIETSTREFLPGSIVMSADDVGFERRVEHTVLGNTVNIAVRLEAFVAQPGDTVIGPATQAAIAAAIRTEDLGAQALKGIREPVSTFRVLGKAPFRPL